MEGSGCGSCREKTGEYRYEIRWGKSRTFAEFRVLPDREELLYRRCRFLAEKQQCREEKSHLYGAFLIYDLEEGRQFYSHKNDYNGGRERVGMGVLLAHALRKHPDPELMESLKLYVDYVMRELYDGGHRRGVQRYAPVAGIISGCTITPGLPSFFWKCIIWRRRISGWMSTER